MSCGRSQAIELPIQSLSLWSTPELTKAHVWIWQMDNWQVLFQTLPQRSLVLLVILSPLLSIKKSERSHKQMSCVCQPWMASFFLLIPPLPSPLRNYNLDSIKYHPDTPGHCHQTQLVKATRSNQSAYFIPVHSMTDLGACDQTRPRWLSFWTSAGNIGKENSLFIMPVKLGARSMSLWMWLEPIHRAGQRIQKQNRREQGSISRALFKHLIQMCMKPDSSKPLYRLVNKQSLCLSPFL